MKKNIFYILITLLAVSCTERENYNLSLSGTVEGVESGTVYLQKFRNKSFYEIDSTQIVNGQFSFKTNVELPEIYGLSLDTERSTFLIFLDENPTTVHLDSSQNYRNTVVKGSELHDLYVDFRSRRDVQIDEFIKEHPSSLVSAYALYRFYSYRLTPEELRYNIDLLDPALKNTPYVEVLEELIPTLEVVSVGNPAPDFAANDPEGNTHKLSDYIGKSDYLFLDFWASWCGPCRRENPNIVKAYEKYKDKGFDIFAVSLDSSRDGWVTAIEKDGLVWTNVSDLLLWDSEPAKLYGVRAIPANFLIDKNGVIVAKNLKGEDLHNTLEELLN